MMTYKSDCETCPLISTRRDFVRDAVATVAGVIASLGLSRSALALPVTVIEALGRSAENITYAIPPKDGVQIDKDNEVILVRWQNVVYAFSLACPHQNTELRWSDTAKQFQCPKHKSKYTPSGGFISGRATRGMDRFAISRQGNSVVIDADQLFEEDEHEAQWKAAFVKLA